MDQQKIAGILDRLHARMPAITRRVGWAGFLLGPALGLLHLLSMLLLPGLYGRRIIAQYELVERTGDWLAAPLAHYLTLLGFVLCLLWLALWALRLTLAARARWGSRWSELSV